MNKIIFLNQLRGIASLTVVFTHLFLMYFVAQPTISRITNAPIIEFENRPIWVHILPYLSNINLSLGAFGVGLFFIISGFVIAISIEKYRSINFLIGRFFRLYPTYAIGLGISIGFLYLSSTYFDTPFTVTFSSYLKNISLFRDLYWIPPIDFIVWTLEIEIKFYLVIALLYVLSRNTLSIKSILIFCLLITSISYIIFIKSDPSELHVLLLIINYDAAPITYMFIGTIFYLHYKSRITTKSLVLILTIIITLVYINFTHTFKHYSPLSNGYALIVFIISYIYRSKFYKNKFLDFFADISYTLYVTHSIIGYTILTILYQYSSNHFFNMTLTLLVIITISYLLHIFIEGPTHILGQKMMQNK